MTSRLFWLGIALIASVCLGPIESFAVGCILLVIGAFAKSA